MMKKSTQNYYLYMYMSMRRCDARLQAVPNPYQGRIQGDARRPKIGKNMIFWHTIVIFHTKYLNNFRAFLRNWKKYDFLAYNRDFSHEIPQQFSPLPPLGAIFFKCAHPNLKSWIRPCILHFMLHHSIHLSPNNSKMFFSSRIFCIQHIETLGQGYGV